MIESRYYDVKREDLTKTDFWTNRLYNEAYDIVKDRKFPIVIPSYNRPENTFCRWATKTFKPNETWPIYVVVRASQADQYRESKYIKGYNFIQVLPFEDSEIDDIGKVRKKIIEHFSQTERCVFMLDDDNIKLSYTVPFQRDTGSKVSLSVKNIENTARLFAMWQVAMEKAMEVRDDLLISTAMIAGFNWQDKFCDEEESIRFMSGPQVCTVCVNLDTFKKYNLNYKTIVGNGHEDLDLLIRALQAGCTTAEFRWLSYYNPGVGTDLLNFESVEKRFTQQYQEMYDHYGDVDFVKWKHAKNGKSLDNVGINWRKAIEYHNNVLTDAEPLNTRFYNLMKMLHDND